MRRLFALIIIGLILFWGSFVLGFSTDEENPNFVTGIKKLNFVKGEILVKYRASVEKNALKDYEEYYGARTIERFMDGAHRVKLPKDVKVEEALELYNLDSQVEYTEPNYHFQSDEYNVIPAFPNDPDFGKQWSLHNTGQSINKIPDTIDTQGTPDADIDAPEAWSIPNKGEDNGRDIVIAFVGTGGAVNHPDLAGNIWINPDENPDDGIDNDGNGYIDDTIGWDFYYNRKNPVDGGKHETSAISISAALGNDSIGMIGVFPRAKIMVLKSANALGVSPASSIIAAIEYANDKGADVINLSLGGIHYSQALKEAIATSSAVVVCSAGNDGENNDINPHYPASYDLPNIIAVAATDQKDLLTLWSNYGLTVHVGAPGANMYVAIPARKTVWSENFDNGNINNWETGGTNNTWGVTRSQYISGSHSLTDSPGEYYQNNTKSWARILQPIDLTTCAGSKLDFYIGGNIERGYDFLYVQTSQDNLNWENNLILMAGVGYMYSISGSTGKYWMKATISLEEYDGGKVYVRFYLTTDPTDTYDGYYFDKIAITTSSDHYTGNEYSYMDGTSFSAPVVSGIAASIKNQKPSLTNLEIISIIFKNVDKIDSLIGRILTGGRVNLYKCLFPPLPTEVTAEITAGNNINLSWKDNSPNETGFRIERIQNGGDWQEIATLQKDTTNYKDGSLEEGDSCCYRVIAFNQNGCLDLDNCPEVSVTVAQCGDGDVAPLGNPDGIVNVGDALIALRFALGLETPSPENICHGDVAPLDATGQPNPDGQITVGDALVILRKALGLL